MYDGGEKRGGGAHRHKTQRGNATDHKRCANLFFFFLFLPLRGYDWRNISVSRARRWIGSLAFVARWRPGVKRSTIGGHMAAWMRRDANGIASTRVVARLPNQMADPAV